MTQTILTEDGVTLRVGQVAYCYYSMKPGRIEALDVVYNEGKDRNKDVWFNFRYDDGGRDLLNGQRICTALHARRRGFPFPEEALR